MSDLPQGWSLTTFGELFDFKGGSQPPKSTFRDTAAPGYVRLLQIRDFESDAKAVFIKDHHKWPKCSAEDIMIGRYGASVGKILGGKAGAYNVALVRMIFDHDSLHPGWVKQLLRSDYFQNPLANISRSAQNGFNKSDLAPINVPLPPLPEQRRIVAKIDSFTGKSRRACDHLDHIPRLVEKYKQAILAAAFRGDLTREWREGRSLAATRSVLLGEVAEGFNYGSAAKSAKQGRVPVLRMGNIQDGKLDWADLVFTDDAAEIAKYRLKNGDVLFNRTNSPALVGKTALFTGKREAIYAGYLIKVRCKPQLLPAFLTYCLNAPNGRAYSWEVKTDGVSQSNINAKKLAAFRFDLPSVQEQEEIVRRIERALSWINRVTVDATSARKLIDHLDNSVLAKAFRGELVPQDPADEPASALLDRIREERAAAPKAKRGRKKAA